MRLRNSARSSRSPLEPVARRLQAVPHLEQLRLLAVEAALDAPELALGRGDLALNRVDPGVEALNRRAEHALARLVPLDLLALLLDARRQRRRQSRQRQQQERQDGKGDWQQEALLHHGRSAAGFPTFTPVMQGFSALSTAAL
jgi:hypothetical protein